MNGDTQSNLGPDLSPLGSPGDGPAHILREARQRVDGYEQRQGRHGGRTTRLYTAAVDNSITRLLRRLVADGGVALGGSVCVVATGGYGRKMLCPHSDVDLLVVTESIPEDMLGELTSRLLAPLWDAGLDVGHKQGRLDQILSAAESDITGKMALLDLRFVAGSRVLYDAVRRGVDASWLRWSHDFPASLRASNRTRFSRYGESVFLLEPQVKEGKGGLRDFHWLLWAARVRMDARGDYDLLLGGLVEPEHYETLTEAYEFLLRVRVQLHLHTGRREDRLLFDYQEPVARALGYKAAGGLMAVERFMGAYYAHAYALAHTCGLYIARMMGFYWDEADVVQEPEGLTRGPLLVGPSAPSAGRVGTEVVRSADGFFVLEAGSVFCIEPSGLQEHPLRILALFRFLQEEGGRLHHDTTEHVRAALGRVGARFRRQPQAAEMFRQVLAGPEVFRTLVAMHRSGFLGRYIPEFGACFCQAQHNRVHLYTVDVHCLYVVRELEALADHSDEPLLQSAWASEPRKDLLILAGLLHDIAKAHGTAHSRVGAETARTVLHRLGFGEPDVASVEWLVRHHLLLSDVAYHRDLHDPATLANLRAVIPDDSHLDSLFTLTWADTRATNPKLATSWKRALLEQTWRAARRGDSDGMAGGAAPLAPDESVRARLEAQLCAELPRSEVLPLLHSLLDDPLIPPDHLRRYSVPDLAVHAVLLFRIGQAGAPDFTTPRRQDAAAAVTRWTVCAPDRVGLFGLLCGSLSAAGLNIVTADTITRSDDLCIDTFSVVDQQGRPITDEGRWRRVERLLGRVLAEDYSLETALAELRPPEGMIPEASGRGRVVTVSNDLSERATVVEVVTLDRPGLVYDITRVLTDFRLDLRVAKIATRHDLASDTFYVVGRGGRQVGARRRSHLARVLSEQFT